jgi:hypothetical protein
MMRDEIGRGIGRGIGNGIGRGIGMLIKVALIVLIVIVGFGQGVYHLWNWLMPTLFRLPAITYWQSVGLLALSWLLFGGGRGFFGRGGRHIGGPWRRGQDGRWERMTPEEREKLREVIRGRCGQGPAEAQAKV